MIVLVLVLALALALFVFVTPRGSFGLFSKKFLVGVGRIQEILVNMNYDIIIITTL